jgi:hypothetical protein
MGLVPVTGALLMVFLFVESCIALVNSGSTMILGIGAPVAIGAGSLLAGFVLMMLARLCAPAFFRQKLSD